MRFDVNEMFYFPDLNIISFFRFNWTIGVCHTENENFFEDTTKKPAVAIV